MICWPPFWHELVRTLGKWNLYVVATWPWIAPNFCPQFFSSPQSCLSILVSILPVHVFGMFHRCNRIWTNGGNQQLWWRTRATNSRSNETRHRRRFQDRTAECPICFETLWTATPTAFVKLVEGQLMSTCHMPCSKKRHLMISPQLMLCLAPRSAAENQKQRRIHQCGHFPILCMKLFGGSMESIVGSHEFVTFCSLHGESQLVRSSLSFEYATKRPSFSRSSLETALQPLAVRASIPMGQVGGKCLCQIQSTIFVSLKVTDIFRKTNMSLEK